MPVSVVVFIRRRVTCAIVVALTLVAGLAPLPAQVVPSGSELLARMHREYERSWYGTLTFLQRTIYVQPSGQRDTVMWYESIGGPTKLRIDFRSPTSGDGALFTADSTFVIRGNNVARSVANGNPFMPLIMGAYLQPPAETARQLQRFGFDLSLSFRTRWQGVNIIVVGASSESDSTSAQFWIEEPRLLLVRMRGAVQTLGGADVIVGGYERVGDAWLGTRVELRFPSHTQLEEYLDWRPNANVAAELFDIAKWASARHWARGVQ